MAEKCCPNCGCNIFVERAKGLVCESCGTRIKTDDDFGEASSIMRDIEARLFENAVARCQSALREHPTNSKLNWLYFLAKNNIYYVSDPVTKERKPTFFNDFFTRDKVSSDKNLKLAIENAEPDTAEYYKKQAEKIEAFRLEACDNMGVKNYCDIFISFKAKEEVTDKAGNVRRVDTEDVKIGRELYEYFTKRNYTVFFSPVSIGEGDVEGENYEPKIFSALASCQCMILIGTQGEYLESEWVKNEWTRYLYFADAAKVGKNSRLRKPENSLLYVYDRDVPSDLPYQINQIQGYNNADRDFLERIFEKVRSIIGAGNRAGVTRVKLGGGSKKKAKTVAGETLQTAELGNFDVSKKSSTVKGNLVVKSLESKSEYHVPASTQRIIENAYDALKNRRFDAAMKRFDSVLQSGENFDAIYGKILCSIKTKSEEDFVINAERFKEYPLLDRAIECADKEQLVKIADLVLNACKTCFADCEIDEGVAFFNVLIKYNIPQRKEVISFLKERISKQVLKDESRGSYARADKVIEAYLSSIDAGDVDVYIKEAVGIVEAILENKNVKFDGKANKVFDLAEKYNNKILDIDPSEHEALVYSIVIQLRCSLNPQELANTFYLGDMNLIKRLIQNSPANIANEDIDFINESILSAVKKCGKGGLYTNPKESKNKQLLTTLLKPLDQFKAILEFNFKNRESAKKQILSAVLENIKNGVFYPIDYVTDFVDYILKSTDGSLVDNHIEYSMMYAINRRELKDFDTAIKYLEKVISIDESNVEARYNLVMAKVKSFDDDISENLPFFYNKHGNKPEITKDLEDMLGYALTNKKDKKFSFSSLITDFTDSVIEGLKKKIVKPAEADIIYCTFLSYIPEEEHEFMIDRSFAMGYYLHSIAEFKLAEQYYKKVLREDEKNFNAYWACIHTELEAKDIVGILLSSKSIEECQEYDNACNCASKKQSQYLNATAYKQDAVKEGVNRKKYKKLLTSLAKNANANKDLIKQLDDATSDNFDSILANALIVKEKRNQEERKQRAQEVHNAEVAFGIGVCNFALLPLLSLVLSFVFFVIPYVILGVDINAIFELIGSGEIFNVLTIIQLVALLLNAIVPFIMFCKSRKYWNLLICLISNVIVGIEIYLLLDLSYLIFTAIALVFMQISFGKEVQFGINKYCWQILLVNGCIIGAGIAFAMLLEKIAFINVILPIVLGIIAIIANTLMASGKFEVATKVFIAPFLNLLTVA